MQRGSLKKRSFQYKRAGLHSSYCLLLVIVSLFTYRIGRRVTKRAAGSVIQNDTRGQGSAQTACTLDSLIPSPIPFPTPKKLRTYHRCISENIPYVSGVLETAQHLLLTNKSLIRFGDCDIKLMMGQEVYFQKPDRVLSARLLQTLQEPLENVMIGLPDGFSMFPQASIPNVDFWYDEAFPLRKFIINHVNMTRQYFATGISTPYVHTIGTHCQLVDETYRTLRKVWKDKEIVMLRGDNKQVYRHDVFDTARTQTILYAPRYQAWNSYDSLKQLLLEQNSEAIVILSAGPVSKVLGYDLVKAGRRVLELGHLSKDYNEFIMQNHPADFWVD